jgi:hypothetical protein
MRRLAILLAVLLLPGCVHHPAPYGHWHGPVGYSRGYAAPYWSAPRAHWHAPPPRHWHGWHGGHHRAAPHWHGQAHAHRGHGHGHAHRSHRHHHWR